MQFSNNLFRDKHTKYSTYINNNKNSILTTLDNKHQEKINEFSEQDKILRKKKKRINVLGKELDELNNLDLKQLSQDIITVKSNLKNEYEHLQIEITQLENRTNELDYFDKTIDTLLEYYAPTDDNKKSQETNIINFTDIFKQKNVSTTIIDKSKLYDKYMKLVYNTNTRKTKNTQLIKICNKCKIEKTIHINDGYYICTSCGESELILLENDKQTYKDSNNDSKACAYKRGNHLSEILNQFQAKESTEIDKEIYKRIREELKIQRIYDYKILDHKLMKKILKKLKFNKYYEHIHHIINNLNNIPPPTMTREQEETIKRVFKEIQKPFSIYRPKKRKNFLNYNYIIHKICELYEYDEFLLFFPLLKSRINLEEQDLVWEKICRYKNYEFIPSI